MVLDIILKEIQNYKGLITSSEYDELYKWEALKNFQDTWDIQAEDLRTMYDLSFRSKTTGNLWANPHWFPKGVMLRFIEHDKERVRLMFANLFDEGQDVEKRIEHFVFNCDGILEEVSSYDKSMKHHFHDGQRIISLYLAFRFPQKYAIYKFTEFKTFMEVVRAANIPQTGECERFFKVVRTICGILNRDSELTRLHRALLTDDHFQGETLMLAQDFIFRTARRYMN